MPTSPTLERAAVDAFERAVREDMGRLVARLGLGVDAGRQVAVATLVVGITPRRLSPRSLSPRSLSCVPSTCLCSHLTSFSQPTEVTHDRLTRGHGARPAFTV